MIHELRTTIKKMRALSQWMGVESKTDRKYVQQLYKIAGRIRDAQLLLKSASNKNEDQKNTGVIPPSFIEWLTKYLESLKEEWTSAFSGQKINKWLDGVAEDMKKAGHHKISKKAVERFTIEKNNNLAIFENERPLNDKQIHTGRKTIKEIQFVNKWQIKNSGSLHTDVTADKMKMISDKAGEFMDTCKGIELLVMYIDDETNEAFRSSAEELLKEWEKNKEQERLQIENAIESLKK